MTLSKLKEKWEGQDIGSQDMPEVDLWYLDLKDYIKDAFRGYKISGFNIDSLFFTGFISKDGKNIYISHEVGVGPIDFDTKGRDFNSWGFFVWDKSEPKSDGEFCSINALASKVKEFFENVEDLTLYVQLVDRAKVDKVLVNGEKYRPGMAVPCKVGDKISLVHQYDQTRAWDYIDKSGNLKELGVGDVCSFIVPKVVDADDRYAELLVYQNTSLDDIFQGGTDYLNLKKSSGWVKNIVPRVRLAESKSIQKCKLIESVQKITLEQFLDVYDCDMNGVVEVHTRTGLLFKLPLEDDDTLDVGEFLSRPIYRIDRYSDCLSVYLG